MDDWGFNHPSNIIDHNASPATNKGKRAKWMKHPFEHSPRPRADLNLEPLVHKSGLRPLNHAGGLAG